MHSSAASTTRGRLGCGSSAHCMRNSPTHHCSSPPLERLCPALSSSRAGTKRSAAGGTARALPGTTHRQRRRGNEIRGDGREEQIGFTAGSPRGTTEERRNVFSRPGQHCHRTPYAKVSWYSYERYGFTYHPMIGRYKVVHVPTDFSNRVWVFTLEEASW
jgi:hypothetical protein